MSPVLLWIILMLTNHLKISINTHTKKTYCAEDDLNNVPNYADISLSGPPPSSSSSSYLSFFPSLHVWASTLVSCPSTQLLCVIAIRWDGREAPKLGPKWDFLHGEGHRPGHGNESLYITIRPTILFILQHITLTPHNYRGVTDGPVRHGGGGTGAGRRRRRRW